MPLPLRYCLRSGLSCIFPYSYSRDSSWSFTVQNEQKWIGASGPAAHGPIVWEQASLRQALLIFRRRWRLFLSVLCFTVALAGVYTFTTTKLYRPQATLEIKPEAPQVSSREDSGLEVNYYLWDSYYRTQEAILTSPTLLRAVLKDLPDVERDYAGTSDAIKAFANRIEIEKVRSSFIMKIGFVDANPDKATRALNALVTHYLEDANRRLRDLKTGTVDLLSRETLPAIRQKLDEADKALQAFKSETGFIDFNEQYASYVEARRKIASRLTDLRLKRATLRAEAQALASYGMDGVSGAFNPAFHTTRILEFLVQQRAKLQEDLIRETKAYKGMHPRISELRAQVDLAEEKIREAIRGTLAAIDSDLDKVDREGATLTEDQRKVETMMGEVGRQLTRFSRLDSELAAAREVYNSYLRKHGETTATSGTGLQSVRAVDWGVEPKHPYKPRVFMNMALGLLVGLFCGLAAVLVTEQLDDRIASAREVEAFVGLPVLSVIPKLKEGGAANSKPILLAEGSSLVEFESFRSLRTEIATRLETVSGSKVIAVLSSLESEGKSTVAINLARAISLEGRRVLILDADLRRPSVRPMIGKGEGVGLSEVLSGEAAFESAIYATIVPGVDVLGASLGTSKAAELAGSVRFDDTLRRSRERYDYVIIDSAPVNQVSESVLVARRADAAILVIRDKQSGRGEVQSARKRLDGAGVNLLGAVLNCASGKGSTYGYYYYSAYSYYSPSEQES